LRGTWQWEICVIARYAAFPAELEPRDEETSVRSGFNIMDHKLGTGADGSYDRQGTRISALALRYQNVYGPGQSLSNPYTASFQFLDQNLNVRASTSLRTERRAETFVYIDDVVCSNG